MTDSASQMQEVPTTGVVRLPPDPRSLEALGRNHTLEAALAELVDNSIDARATQVLIRFVRDGDRLVRLLVIDDGCGMDTQRIDVAMTVGGARAYGSDEIGRFGLGLKAASFSQARSVTVVSRTASSEAVGRRWRLEHAKQDFCCEIVDAEFAAAQLGYGEPSFAATGTIVRWDEVKGFPATRSCDEVERFVRSAFASIRSHLGLIFHRLLERDAVRVLLDVEDLTEGVLIESEVVALNPFGYPRSGAPGWPKQLRVEDDGRAFELACHIWPGRSNTDEFRLDGDLLSRQGLYVYYNDRLVQRGGWNGLVHADKQLNLARAALNIAGDIDRVLALKPEKNGIEVGPSFARLVHGARVEGLSFGDYIEQARGVLKESNRRRRERTAVLPPGTGFDRKLRRAITAEMPMMNDDPIDIRWAPLPEDKFFAVDRDERVLWLNKRYRHALLGGRRGGLNDVPVIKALMYLLLEHIFAGQNLGPRDKDNLEVWQALLTAAAKAQAS